MNIFKLDSFAGKEPADDDEPTGLVDSVAATPSSTLSSRTKVVESSSTRPTSADVESSPRESRKRSSGSSTLSSLMLPFRVWLDKGSGMLSNVVLVAAVDSVADSPAAADENVVVVVEEDDVATAAVRHVAVLISEASDSRS